MSKLYFCVGKKAEKPYQIKPFHMRIYTLEELCFYICENAQMLDRDFMAQELIDFIAEELDLKVLSQKLGQLVHFGGSLHAFCGLLLEEAAYRSPEEIKRIENVLEANESLTRDMRLEKQAEHMLQKKEYYKAIKAYGNLYMRYEGDVQKQARIMFQMGQAAVHLFYYDMASQYFLKSHALVPNREALKRSILCRRLLMTRTQYIRYTTEHEEYYELALEIEKQYESAKKKADEISATELADSRQLKEQYRQMMME